jgi:hypothetical protein
LTVVRAADVDGDIAAAIVPGVTCEVQPDALWAPWSTDPMMLLSTRTPPGDGERRDE